MTATPTFIVFSNRAYNAMAAETFTHHPNETGGFFLGHILDNGCWIVTEVVPPGPQSTHEIAAFEYDAPLVNYMVNTVAAQSKIPPRMLGLWHRHPGTMNTFSTVDDETNARLATDQPYGILSGLVNMIPDFHLTLYHTAGFQQYSEVSFAVGDTLIPDMYLELRYSSEGLHPALAPKKKPVCLSESLPPTLNLVSNIKENPMNITPTEMTLKNTSRKPTVYYPASLTAETLPGPLWGTYIAETMSFNVLPMEFKQRPSTVQEIGRIFPESPFEDTTSAKPILLPSYRDCALWRFSASAPRLVAYPQNEKLVFVQYPDGVLCQTDPYSLTQDIFSRNKGLLETDVMLRKGAVLVGCGSVGSLFAVELARAGVGRFLLADNDLVEYHNLCRHQCGILDVGKFKTDAVAERILQINPAAKVQTVHRFIQDVPLEILNAFADEETLFVGGADRRDGDLSACRLAMEARAAFLSVGCWERACAGEIFYCLPEKEMAKYDDLMAAIGPQSHRIHANRIFYTHEKDLKKTVFEPGISTDILYVTTIAIKLALDILNRNNTQYTPRVMDYLTQYTLVCNSNDSRLGGEAVGIFDHPLQVTHSIYIPQQTSLASGENHG